MKTKLWYLPLWLCICLFPFGLKANNIQITTEPTIEKNTLVSGFWYVQFDLSWDNSWRSNNPKNWDAAWLFVKYSIGGERWQHAYLEDTSSTKLKPTISNAKGCMEGGFTDFKNLDYAFRGGKSYIPSLGGERNVGLFLYRVKNGYGRVEFKNVKLAWNFAAAGIAEDDPVTVKVFAIEMVYIPEGSFYIGSGIAEDNSFYQGFSPTSSAYRVISEDSIHITNTALAQDKRTAADSLGLSTQSNVFDFAAPTCITNEFPKGYQAFYMMKYELSQEAYVDFLNTLTIAQQSARTGLNMVQGSVKYFLNGSTGSTTPGYRCGVYLYALAGVGTFVCNLNNDGSAEDKVNQADDGQNVAMNYMNSDDMLAYMAWSGLRPLTELEFEKAARGTQNPTKYEYVWGTTNFLDGGNISTYISAGKPDERPSDRGMNINYSAGGPVRVGCFADSATNRMQAGAGYWGNMDLAGNVCERYISVRYPVGRNYKGIHGYGDLVNENGNFPADLEWNSAAINFITKGVGFAYGGVVYSRTSNRAHVNSEIGRDYRFGGRGGRTAPAN
ncbi:MAG: SUMF1/EgtB/PvdO family nonheme iron enzyme [Bacteroidales bacterium]